MAWLQELQYAPVAVARAVPSDELVGAVLKRASMQVLLWRVQHVWQLSPALQTSATELKSAASTCGVAMISISIDVPKKDDCASPVLRVIHEKEGEVNTQKCFG